MMTMLVVLALLVIAIVVAGCIVIAIMMLWVHWRRCPSKDPAGRRCMNGRGHQGLHVNITKDGLQWWNPETPAAA